MKDKPRKILNLEERVQAIRMYDEIPVYKKVALSFKCSWEQIKNVVANRKTILKDYAKCQIIDITKDEPKLVRHKKINFLGNCMYEYIKRAHFYKMQTVTDDVIRDRAMEFKEIIKIEKFFPNRAWIRYFKSVFNINLEHINQIIISRKPKNSLNCKDIITYCVKEVDNALSSQPGSSGNQMMSEYDSNNIDIADNGENNDDDPSESFEDDEGPEEDGGGDDDDKMINETEEGSTLNYDDYEDPDETQEVKPAINELDNKNEEGPTICYEDYDETEDVKPDINELDNENKEGPTINYGDYEYHDETQDVKLDINELNNANDEGLTINYGNCKDHDETRRDVYTGNNELDNKLKNSEDRNGVKSAQDIKQETNKNPSILESIDKNAKQNFPKPPPKQRASSASSISTTSRSLSLPVNSYVEALKCIHPLQEFAKFEEDVKAIELLNQLAEVYEKAKKRKRLD